MSARRHAVIPHRASQATARSLCRTLALYHLLLITDRYAPFHATPRSEADLVNSTLQTNTFVSAKLPRTNSTQRTIRIPAPQEQTLLQHNLSRDCYVGITHSRLMWRTLPLVFLVNVFRLSRCPKSCFGVGIRTVESSCKYSIPVKMANAHMIKSRSLLSPRCCRAFHLISPLRPHTVY